MLTLSGLRGYFFCVSILLCLAFTATGQDSLRNSIGIKYDLTTFDNNIPWHLVSLEYTRAFKKMPVIARLNYASRFGRSGLQLEAEAYPAISKKIYTYISTGYSDKGLFFPKYRAGFSAYVSLPANFEAEGGFRYLHFSDATWIYTAAIGKYYKNYWFNLSAFLTPDGNRLLQSYFLKSRYYLNDKDFIMLTLGTGISPDDRNNYTMLSTKNLNSKQAEVSFRYTISKMNVILFSAGWMKQEYEFKKYNDQYTLSVGYQRIL